MIKAHETQNSLGQGLQVHPEKFSLFSCPLHILRPLGRFAAKVKDFLSTTDGALPKCLWMGTPCSTRVLKFLAWEPNPNSTIHHGSGSQSTRDASSPSRQGCAQGLHWPSVGGGTLAPRNSSPRLVLQRPHPL